jgi:hypothetical protein
VARDGVLGATDAVSSFAAYTVAMRTLAAVLAMALLLMGVAVPVVLCAVFVLALPAAAAVVRRASIRCAEQPVALRALVLFRGPPSLA